MTEQVIPYHDAHDIMPDEECILCAEKHYSYAMQLSKEIGYVAINRQKIIGELVAAQWHIYKYNEELANKIRDIRHFVQERMHHLVEWDSLCVKFDELIAQDKAETLAKTSDASKWAEGLVGNISDLWIKFPKIKELYEQFLGEKNVGGGCSSCRLKRLNRRYREILNREFMLT